MMRHYSKNSATRAVFNNQMPKTKLWTIAYCSRLVDTLSEADLVGLALHGQARNETLGITGVLFLADGQAVQILEGQHGPVSWLYDQIAVDPRHRNVVTLMDRPLQERNFDGWRMRVMTAEDLRAPERGIVLSALRSEAHGDHGEATATPAAGLAACADAIIAGSLRAPPARPRVAECLTSHQASPNVRFVTYERASRT